MPRLHGRGDRCPAAEKSKFDTDKIRSATEVVYTMVAPITADGTGDFASIDPSRRESATTKAGDISSTSKGTSGDKFYGRYPRQVRSHADLPRTKDIRPVGSVTDWVTGGGAVSMWTDKRMLKRLNR